MKNKWVVRVCLLPMLAGVLTTGYAVGPQEEEKPQWEKKARGLVEKLATFVPQPVAGLIDHMPFESEGRGTQTRYSCGEGDAACGL